MNAKVIKSPFYNSINKLSVEGIIIDKNTARCNRAKLDTGTFCNYDCEFCYYKDQLDVKTSIDVVKKRADYLYNYGITQVDLSGGESSISNDWFDILDYCNKKFEHISCVSHGGKFANKNFLLKSKEFGLKEILFSLHGATEDTHDLITNRKGSFKRILQAIANAQELDLVVRINCTVYNKNYQEIQDKYANLINNIKPFEVNFITLNYWHNVQINNVHYKLMTDSIKKCIDILDKKIIINVRYVPYCYMVGYEKYVCNQFQHIYDLYDWNKEVYEYKIDVSKQYNLTEKLTLAYEHCADRRIRFYHKSINCLNCKYFYICDGVENELDTEVNPVTGPKITEVTYYRKNHFYENVNLNINS